jgi:beta-glucosidase
MKKWIGLVVFFSLSVVLNAQDAKMNAFINQLMAKMTLEEKLGQLNLPSSGDFVTGTAASSDIAKKIEAGKVGGLFNIKSVWYGCDSRI